jgi:hypothetical protein
VLLLNECLLLFISLSTQSGNFWITLVSAARLIEHPSQQQKNIKIKFTVANERTFYVMYQFVFYDEPFLRTSTKSGMMWVHRADYAMQRISFGDGNFFRRRVQTGSEAHPVSYPTGIGASLPCGEAAGA